MKYVKGRYTIMKNKKIIYAVIIAVGIIGVAGLIILGVLFLTFFALLVF